MRPEAFTVSIEWVSVSPRLRRSSLVHAALEARQMADAAAADLRYINDALEIARTQPHSQIDELRLLTAAQRRLESEWATAEGIARTAADEAAHLPDE
jgi:hypothetical protein